MLPRQNVLQLKMGEKKEQGKGMKKEGKDRKGKGCCQQAIGKRRD